MPVGSSRTPEGVSIPDEYDITIVSTSDNEETIRHAIDADEFPTVEDEESDEESAAGGDADEAGAGEEPGAGDEEASAQADTAAPAVDGDYEPPTAGESRAERDARVDRNVQRMQTLVTTQTQQLSTLSSENARLRAAVEGRTEAPRREGDAAPAGERTAPAAPKFEFMSRDKFFEANANATEDDYIIALSDARYTYNRAQEQAAADTTRRQQAVTRLQTETHQHIATVKKDLKDWDTVVRTSESPMTDTMHLTMLKQGELGPRLVYWISKSENLAEAQRIAALEPLDQVAAILDLRDKVRPATPAKPAAAAGGKNGAGATPAQKNGQAAHAAEAIVKPSLRRKASAAPAPLKPVPGEARSAPNLEDLSADEYMDRQDEYDRKRGRRR